MPTSNLNARAREMLGALGGFTDSFAAQRAELGGRGVSQRVIDELYPFELANHIPALLAHVEDGARFPQLSEALISRPPALAPVRVSALFYLPQRVQNWIGEQQAVRGYQAARQTLTRLSSAGVTTSATPLYVFERWGDLLTLSAALCAFPFPEFQAVKATGPLVTEFDLQEQRAARLIDYLKARASSHLESSGGDSW